MLRATGLRERKMKDEVLLEVRDLKVYFPVTRGILRRKVADIKAVDGVEFEIGKGETFGLIGESGSGKTTVGRAITRLVPIKEGKIFFKGKDVLGLGEGELRVLRKSITYIFQDPYSSLNPRQTAGSIVGEPLIIHRLVNSKREYRRRVEELFASVGLDPAMIERYPHEFSGGQRQRLAIARAIASQPFLVICDEPVSALDVSIQAQIINLFQELQEKFEGLSYLFISHDLAVVRHICERIAVMYLGRIVEVAERLTVFDRPLHPYTKALISAVPIPDPIVERRRERIILKGEIPSPLAIPKGCRFSPRCPAARSECYDIEPELREVEKGHYVACALYG